MAARTHAPLDPQSPAITMVTASAVRNLISSITPMRREVACAPPPPPAAWSSRPSGEMLGSSVPPSSVYAPLSPSFSIHVVPSHPTLRQRRRAHLCHVQGVQVACALLLSGENLDNFGDVKNILVEMGAYFQVQDDYLDCYGDPEFIGKIGTYIEDYKCSWLVVQALERADENQKHILFENYGKSDPECVAKVKGLYKELNLELLSWTLQVRISIELTRGIWHFTVLDFVDDDTIGDAWTGIIFE
ncbi:hypothetical protein ABZP36_021168 [Zizania latifolia]